MLLYKELVPIAVFVDPVVLLCNEEDPIAVLEEPDVKFVKAL